MNTTPSELKASGIEALVCSDIAARQQKGIVKYGVAVADNPLSHEQWLNHLYEELLDSAVYLKRSITRTTPSPDSGEKVDMNVMEPCTCKSCNPPPHPQPDFDKRHMICRINEVAKLLGWEQCDVVNVTSLINEAVAKVQGERDAAIAKTSLEGYREMGRQVCEALEQRDQLKTALAECEADKARLDWLENNECSIGFPNSVSAAWFIFTNDQTHGEYDGDTLRAAIDAALAQSQQKQKDGE